MQKQLDHSLLEGRHFFKNKNGDRCLKGGRDENDKKLKEKNWKAITEPSASNVGYAVNEIYSPRK